MRIKVIEKLGGRVHELDAAIVIVEDHLGNPIQVACELATGVYDLLSIRHDNQTQFNRQLRALGIDKLVVAESLDTGAPPDGSQLLYKPLGV